MATYAEAAALAFGSRPFSVAEFSVQLGSSRSIKLLSELKTRGVVVRVSRGRYRLLSPDERPDLRAEEARRVRNLILSSGLPMAWDGPDAAWVWTGGRYTVSPSAYLRVFHIRVPRSSTRAWKDYLRIHRISSDPRRRIGTKVVVHPAGRFRSFHHAGEPVIARSETLTMIRAHRGIYGEADELVEK
jgi:hypothetical protein